MLRFTKDEKVWWITGRYNNIINYGVIRTTSGPWLKVTRYNRFMQLDNYYDVIISRRRLNKFVPEGLSKLQEAIKLINIGRLQYNQHFFRTPKNKTRKVYWRRGYKQYKRLCKEYGVPISPKRAVPNVCEEW